MKRLLLAFCMILGLSGCGEDKKPVEVADTDVYISYADEVKLSEEKKLNYEGYFLGDFINVSTALDLFGGSLDSLVYGWNWELSMKTYSGSDVKLEEGEGESLWGKPVEDEKEPDKEDVEKESSEDIEGSANEELENSEPKIILETTGSSEKLVDIVNKEIVMKKGQVFQILPVYVEPIEEDSEEVITEETDKKEESSEEQEAEGTEEQEEVEPLKENLKSIVVINYSNEDKTLKYCVENGWYTIELNNYVDCFGMKPLENEESIPESEIFKRISELLGNPTIVWEKPLEANEYANNIRRDVFAYEFPEYVLLAEVSESKNEVHLDSFYYIPNGLWYESKEYTGMKNIYKSSYIEIDKSQLPDIEVEE